MEGTHIGQPSNRMWRTNSRGAIRVYNATVVSVKMSYPHAFLKRPSESLDMILVISLNRSAADNIGY